MGNYAVKQLKAKRIVVIDDRTTYGQGLAEQFLTSVKAAGGQIIDRQYVSDKAIDFKSILTAIKADAPDLIYYAGSAPQSAPLVKQARGLAMNARFASGDMSKTEDFIKIGGAAVEGTVVSMPGLPLSKMPGAIDFTEKYKAKFGTEPTTLSPYSFDGAMAIMKAMVAAKSSDPAVYLPVLAKIDMKGVTTDHFSFNNYGDQVEGLITIFKVQDGHFVPIETLGAN
jgi:branched-chain amino acid transport system substrate-binding protein